MSAKTIFLRAITFACLISFTARAYQTWHDPKRTFIVVLDENRAALSYDQEGTQIFYRTPAANLPILHMAIASALSLDVLLGVDSDTNYVTAGTYKRHEYLIAAENIQAKFDPARGLIEYWFLKDSIVLKLYTAAPGKDDALADGLADAHRQGGLVRILPLLTMIKWVNERDWEVSKLSNLEVSIVPYSDIIFTAPTIKPKFALVKSLFTLRKKKVITNPETAFSTGQQELISNLEKLRHENGKIACIKSQCPDTSVYAETATGSCFIVGPHFSLSNEPIKLDPEPHHDNNVQDSLNAGIVSYMLGSSESE